MEGGRQARVRFPRLAFVCIVALTSYCLIVFVLHNRLQGPLAQVVEARQRETSTIAESIYFIIANDVSKDHLAVLDRYVSSLAVKSWIESVEVFTPAGVIVYSLDRSRIGKIENTVTGRTYSTVEMEANDQSKNALCRVRPIFNREACVSCHVKDTKVLGVVEVCRKSDGSPIEDSRLNGITGTVLLPALGSVLLAVFSLVLVRALKP